MTTAAPVSASAPVTHKDARQPDDARPAPAPATSDSANIRPMLAPTSAMALVRTSSRVWSASSAVTAAEMAPAPCSMRPDDQLHQRAGKRRQQAAGGEQQQAEHDHALAAQPVRRHAEHQLQQPCVSP
jgi:hypothetical protein